MEFALIGFVAGVFTGGSVVYVALRWISERPQTLSDRAVSAQMPLDVIQSPTGSVAPLRKAG